MKKALSIVANVLISIVLIFSVIVTFLVILSTRNEDRIPSLFGYAIFAVQSDSMKSDKGFDLGDLIVIKMLDEEDVSKLKVGDVITFRRYYEDKRYIETHRIVPMDKNMILSNPMVHEEEVKDGIWIHGGQMNFVTRGDNTPAIDYQQNGAIDYATAENIIGVWEGTAIPKLGSVMDFLQSQSGFLICIVIPLALFFFFELYRFIVTINAKNKEKALSEISATEEDIKQKAIAEFLAKQGIAPEAAPAEEKKAPDKKDEEPKEKEETEEEKKQRIINEYLAKQADEKAKAEAEEAEKQRIIAEYLASQNGSGEGDK